MTNFPFLFGHGFVKQVIFIIPSFIVLRKLFCKLSKNTFDYDRILYIYVYVTKQTFEIT